MDLNPDSEASGTGNIPMDTFDSSDQQQLVYVTTDGSYIYAAPPGGEVVPSASGMYIYEGDGTLTGVAGDSQGDSDVQYLLVSADEASGLSQQQYIVMPPDGSAETDAASVDPSGLVSVPGGVQVSLSPVKSPEKPELAQSAAVHSTPIVIAPMASQEAVGTTAEVKVKGGTARVTILPAAKSSGGGSAQSTVTTIPIRWRWLFVF